MREVQFSTGNMYHVYNRGVDKRTIFNDPKDFERFYTSLFLFNNKSFSNSGGSSSLRDVELQRLLETSDKAVKLVRVISYCLLPNHFHLLLEQLEEDGIIKFMHRVGMGYARYYNTRHDRTGRLYEGTFKAVLVERDAQLEHLPRYIHLNALDLTNYNWRDGIAEGWTEAEKFLHQYRWSSHDVYIGQTQQLPLVDEQFVREIFSTREQYLSFLRAWSNRSIPTSLRDVG